jgi:hypothetical protein
MTTKQFTKLFKALVISKFFSSFLIGCVRRPTPCTDKGNSSITNNMITFNGISVLNLVAVTKNKKGGCNLKNIHL